MKPILLLTVVFGIGLTPGLQAQQLQDVVYLKNGGMIRGIIIEQVPGTSLKIQTRDGSVFVYRMDEIERITREAPADAAARGPAHSGFAIAGEVGTDVTGGLGFGGGFAFLLMPPGSGFGHEFGLDVFAHGYSETEGGTTEDISLLVFAVRANWLWNYQPKQSHVYFVTGVGFVVASLDWKQTYDPAIYGYSLTEDETYTTVGNVINFGVGWTSAEGFGFRLETPMLFFYSSGQSSGFVPTFTVGVRYFF